MSATPPGTAASRSAISRSSAAAASPSPWIGSRSMIARASATGCGSTVPRSRSTSSQPLPGNAVIAPRPPARPRCWGSTYSSEPAYQSSGRDLVLHVVVAQRDVAPLVGGQLVADRPGRRRTRPSCGRGKTPSISPCSTSTWQPSASFGPERRAAPVRPGPGAAPPARERSSGGIDPGGAPRPRRRPRPAPRRAGGWTRSRRARGVVVARDEDDRRVGQRLAQALELPEGEDDRRVSGPDGVEEIAGDDDRRPGARR